MPRSSPHIVVSPTSADIEHGATILVLPLGSWEQHGPHLPLDTDSRIIDAVIGAALHVVDRSAFIVAPVIPITASDEHAGFPGTLSAGTAATIASVVAIARSATWARGVCIVNGHGGNVDALVAVHHALDHEGIPHTIWSPGAEPGDDLHAGRTETSLMLHIDPAAVRLDALETGTQPGSDAIERMRAGGVSAVAPNGVLGDPTRATAGEGRAILQRYSQSLAHRFDACIGQWTLRADRSPA